MKKGPKNQHFEVVRIDYEEDPEGGFSLTFPDLPGIEAHAETVSEIESKARRILARYLDNLLHLGVNQETRVVFQICQKKRMAA